jgi:hypothetical protein
VAQDLEVVGARVPAGDRLDLAEDPVTLAKYGVIGISYLVLLSVSTFFVAALSFLLL